MRRKPQPQVMRDYLRIRLQATLYTEEMRRRKNDEEPVPYDGYGSGSTMEHSPDGTCGGGRRVIRSPKGLS